MTDIDKNDAEAINAKYGLSAIEKRLDEASEKYATGNHHASYADTHDKRAFEAGACYGIEWVIGLLDSGDVYEHEAANYLREKFAPILERGLG